MNDHESIKTLSINTIRTLSMDAVQKANSGHPGTPMAMAPLAYYLYQYVLRYDPLNPEWENRDRFVLSMGHASALLYSILHLCEVRDGSNPDRLAVELDDIKAFRQLGSKCPGHPEYGLTTGVETTTGPLGQGAANSVGMAIAGLWKAQMFNRPDLILFDYNVYALCSDGCIMEGLTGEAASLAGHLKLSNLCWIYDSNQITIEGNTSLAFSEDVSRRFESYGWKVTTVDDVNNLALLESAFNIFSDTDDRPTLIILKSHIGYGSPNKQDTASAHGEPLGEDEIGLTKRSYGWPEDASFLVPDSVYDHFRELFGKRGKELFSTWRNIREDYEKQFPQEAEQLKSLNNRRPPADWDRDLPTFAPDTKGIASRVSSGKVLNAIAAHIPWLMGGSADLAPSTKTELIFDNAGVFTSENRSGRNFHFGIREHAMCSIINGMSLSHLRPYGSTFLIFSDYARPAIRLSAIIEIPAIYIFTHDSIGVGEDGPTHQPVEHLASLRAIPGLVVIRPADANEVVEAWRTIIPMQDRPVALVLTRQALPTLDRDLYASAEGLSKGGYILADADRNEPDIILIASGSEVHLALDAHRVLLKEGIKSRVVSMPSWELFEMQSNQYRTSVLPPSVTSRIAIEQGATTGWERYTGSDGHTIGMHSFGGSAPYKKLQSHFGFTTDNIITAARSQLQNGV